MARMGFLDKAEELDVMIEAERARLKKVRTCRCVLKSAATRYVAKTLYFYVVHAVRNKAIMKGKMAYRDLEPLFVTLWGARLGRYVATPPLDPSC